MPLTKVTTAITADTPITTPSSVSTDRSLFAQSDSSAIRIASEVVISACPCDITAKFKFSSLLRPGRAFRPWWQGIHISGQSPIRVISGEVACHRVERSRPENFSYLRRNVEDPALTSWHHRRMVSPQPSG